MVSVVIPTLNERDFLAVTLQHVKANDVEHECIVVDGGSVDGTVEIAESAGAQVVISNQCQRAAQMNLGARQARGDILVFLHADTRLPPAALTRIEQKLADPHVVGGAFTRRFNTNSFLLRLTCRLAEARSHMFGWHLGDQAMFVRRDIFQKLGGFREIGLFEDLDFSRRLARLGRVVTLRPAVISSDRRFQSRGPLATTMRDVWLTLRYVCGEDPDLFSDSDGKTSICSECKEEIPNPRRQISNKLQ